MMQIVTLLLFIPLALCDLCPSKYKQGSDGGDCYEVLIYYDTFTLQYTPTSFDDAEISCNHYGGMLTSIHSQEEQDMIARMGNDGPGQCYSRNNIGLRCVGKDCRWDDGTPLDFTYFDGEGPADDGALRCYGLASNKGNAWQSKNCGTQKQDCWICRAKAQRMECEPGEYAYKGGCVSVHSTPQDQKAAEASCPGGGHLVSIHSVGENDKYMQWAMASDLNGTFYIGGQFSNGAFEWIDGTHANDQGWAKGFPNTIFGTCVQMLLESEFGTQGQWTNIDCSVKQPYMCFRDGSKPDPTSTHPKADAHCSPLQYYEGSGTIFSPNYPLSIPASQSCEYVIGTKDGSMANVKFNVYDCKSGTTLSLYDGMNSNQPFKVFTSTTPKAGESFTATSNVMKIVFTANITTAPVGTGWEAEFDGRVSFTANNNTAPVGTGWEAEFDGA